MLSQLTLPALGAVAILAFAGCSRTAAPGPNPKVTRANFDKVEIGMSMDEVKVILGEPWKVEQSDGPNEFVTIDNVQVRAIYEWNLGSEVDTKAIELGFKTGKSLPKLRPASRDSRPGLVSPFARVASTVKLLSAEPMARVSQRSGHIIRRAKRGTR